MKEDSLLYRVIAIIVCAISIIGGVIIGILLDDHFSDWNCFTAEERNRSFVPQTGPYTTEYDYSLELPNSTDIQIMALSATIVEPKTFDTVTEVVTEQLTEPEETKVIIAETEAPAEEPVLQIVWTDLDETYAVYIAKTLYGECRACTTVEQAAVVWCVLNRVDSIERYFPDDIVSVITQPSQFLGYNENNPVREDLLTVARDVLMRWYAEKNGQEDVGRVLPRDYCFFFGDGKHNYFTELWKGTDIWNWSLTSPYEQ